MKINKKLSAFILAGALTCTTPAMVYADDSSSDACRSGSRRFWRIVE